LGRCPGAGAQHQTAGAQDGLVGADHDLVAVRFPAEDGGVVVEVRARAFGEGQLGPQRLLRVDDPGSRVVYRAEAGGQSQPGKIRAASSAST
jgi:hypothetical protein